MNKTLSHYIEALTILAQYSQESYALQAEHDAIYTRPGCGCIQGGDKSRLEELGWFEDEELDCWCCFV